MNNDNRIRLLAVLRILESRKVEDEPITSISIVEILKTKGISANRKSVLKDLEALRDMDIAVYSKKRGWKTTKAIRDSGKKTYFGTFG